MLTISEFIAVFNQIKKVKMKILVYFFQSDINGIYSWSKTWDLHFNTSKCCVLHFSRLNIKSSYKINDSQLKSKCQEKDLGILFSARLKFNEHMDAIISKANRQLGIITRVFKQKNPQTIIPLYKSFVRPFLEYNSIIWSPYSKTYIQKVERLQEKMCNLLGNLRSLPYKEKLIKLKLQSLRARRIKHQLAFMFKMKHELIDLRFDSFFLENKYKKTRGNVFKLVIPKSKTVHRKHFFTNSIIKHWNLLKSTDINVRTIRQFKINVDNYFKRSDIW